MTETNVAPPLEKLSVDVRAIERELTDLWQSAADSADSGREGAVTRTCVLNLIVLTRESADAERATQIVDRLTDRHPNRAIVASLLPGADQPGLDAWVQAHCQLPVPGRPQVCCEQITLEARGPEAELRVPGVILPLLVPDVPVTVWVPRGAPGTLPAVARLADVTDRLIVDSGTFGDEMALTTLAAIVAGGTALSDLAWARLTHWRELVAQFFDSPALVPHLAEVEQVVVASLAPAGQPLGRTQALLLAGWIAARLGWRVAEGRAVRPDGAPVAVEIVDEASESAAGDRVARIEIVCRRARFTVARHADAARVETRAEVQGGWPVRRTGRLATPDEAQQIAGELQLFGHDRTFEEALHAAAALAGSR